MKREFLVERQGRAFVLYAGLLEEAHAQGLNSIRTQLIQAPSAQNGQVAICFAEVTTEKGVFTGLGDASPENVSRMMAPHLIRMAETRAKARALRDSINVGVTALEELGELEESAANANEPKMAEPRQNGYGAQPMAQSAPAAPRSFAPALSRERPQPDNDGSDRLGGQDQSQGAARPIMAPGVGAATEAQMRAIHAIARNIGFDEESLIEQSLALVGAPPTALTRRQASDLITALKARQAA